MMFLYIKKIFITTVILLITGCSNPANSEASINRESNSVQYNITLNCDDFELNNDQLLLCDYWKNFNEFDSIINLKNLKEYNGTINNIRDLSPIDFAFTASTKITYKDKVYEANIYPNSRIELIDKNHNNLNLICQSDACSSYFLWPFVDEYIAATEPHLANEPDTLIEKIYTKNYKSYLNKMSKQSIKDKLAVKVYFENPNLDDSDYVIRFVNKESPLKNAIQEYLNGLTPEEKKLGFESSNFGNDSFQVKIKDKTALVNFTINELEIIGPEQILKFTYNISKTAEQFKTVDETEICVNNIYNYQMAFLANEDAIDCPFSF